MAIFIGASSKSTKDDVRLFPCKDHRQQTFYNEKGGGKQNKDDYKDRLIACIYEHKLHCPHYIPASDLLYYIFSSF